MNQYERIVAYIHQYQEGNKGANVGYAKIEKRGDNCRIQVQMRSSYINKSPKIFLFKQLEWGITTVPVGEMTINGNELKYKGSTEVAKVFGSELSMDEVDGLLIYLHKELYFATSWKKDSIYLGDWNGEKRTERTATDVNSVDREEEQIKKEEVSRKENEAGIKGTRNEARKEQEMEISNLQEGRENKLENTQDRREKKQENETAKLGESREKQENQGENREVEAAQIQMQAICGICPFKRQNMDYGKRILLSFPTMRPFPEEKGADCVRLELQDIGCLPMKYWSLSGNRFLLHGYYCYRHLIFCRKERGKYMLGVPGIYSDREEKNACRFGFESFQSIGGFGKQQGAFGYWLMELM